MKSFFKKMIWLVFVLQFKLIKLIKKPYIIFVVGKEKSLQRRKLIELLKYKGFDVKIKIKPYSTWFGVLLDVLDLSSAYSDIFKWFLVFLYSVVNFLKHLIFYPKILVLEGSLDETGEANKFIFGLNMDVIFFTGIEKQFIDDYEKFNILLSEYKKLVGFINKRSNNTFIRQGDYDELLNLFRQKEKFCIFIDNEELKDLMKICSRSFILKLA